MTATAEDQADIVLVGGGIMSATFGTLVKELQPGASIVLFESLGGPAEESSNAWNNAGTGHAALCELNYTPQAADGSVDIARALKVYGEFDLSRQFWSYLVRKRALGAPESFIHTVPHVSFVRGQSDVAFLRARFAAMAKHHCFEGMQYSEHREQMAQWMPLVMEDRDPAEAVAATYTTAGTDVDFGALARGMFAHLAAQPGFAANYGHRVTDLRRAPDGRWIVTARDARSGAKQTTLAKFVFLGAGGGALALLQKSGIPEGKGFGGFPVSGIWLRSDNRDLASRHDAKVYGKASVGAPPMSVPHLDTRHVDGKRALLFGPYAGFSTKFLKNGSYADMFASIKGDNLGAMLAVGRDNFDLTKYLVGEVLQSLQKRFESLQLFFPDAKPEDWRLEVAGQRVQVIMPDKKSGGKLQFGTEVIAAADGSMAAVLGASPGASTSVAIMLNVIKSAFKDRLGEWTPKLTEMIPSYGRSIADDADLCRSVRAETSATLHLSP